MWWCAADCVQRKWAPATEQVQAMEDEIKDFDATRKPLEITKARTKKKYDDARKELRSAEVCEMPNRVDPRADSRRKDAKSSKGRSGKQRRRSTISKNLSRINNEQ